MICERGGVTNAHGSAVTLLTFDLVTLQENTAQTDDSVFSVLGTLPEDTHSVGVEKSHDVFQVAGRPNERVREGIKETCRPNAGQKIRVTILFLGSIDYFCLLANWPSEVVVT